MGKPKKSLVKRERFRGKSFVVQRDAKGRFLSRAPYRPGAVKAAIKEANRDGDIRADSKIVYKPGWKFRERIIRNPTRTPARPYQAYVRLRIDGVESEARSNKARQTRAAAFEEAIENAIMRASQELEGHYERDTDAIIEKHGTPEILERGIVTYTEV